MFCRLILPGGGGGGGRLCEGIGGAIPGIGGGGRLARFSAVLVDADSSRGERGGDRISVGGEVGGRGGGDLILSAAVLSAPLSWAAPDSSSSDSEPSVGDSGATAAGAGGGGRATTLLVYHSLRGPFFGCASLHSEGTGGGAGLEAGAGGCGTLRCGTGRIMSKIPTNET